jgi:inner membrane protein
MNKNLGNQFKNWTDSIVFKGVVTFFLGLLILIPVGQIKSLLTERENRMYMVKEEVIDKWGGYQYIAGPILLIPVIENYTELYEGKKQLMVRRHYLHLLPDELIISGDLESELRKKGIYNIELYTGSFNITGSFTGTEIQTLPYPDSEILWEEAELIIGVGDVKGLSGKVDLLWDNIDYSFEGGAGKSGLLPSGIHTRVPLTQNSNYTFQANLELRGGESISFIPLGKETRVNINSNWPSPNFQGAFLPESHNLTKTDFSAEWNIHALARNFPQNWIDTQIDFYKLQEGSFGVNFISPIDGYFKNQRAIKYRLMFIFIPFIALFLFEIFTKTKVHPFQYILVGFAISMFFLLLLAISEHLSFSISYLISAGVSSLMVSAYSGTVFRSKNKGSIMLGINIILYLYLYMSLVSEDYALIIGSLGLFIILALTMVITRKLNWYKL